MIMVPDHEALSDEVDFVRQLVFGGKHASYTKNIYQNTQCIVYIKFLTTSNPTQSIHDLPHQTRSCVY